MKVKPERLEVPNSSVDFASAGPKEVNGSLSQDEVILRLFAPSNNLQELRNKQAIVVISAEKERAVSHKQVENLLAHAIEQLRERGVKESDKLVFFSENSPELTSTILACWALKSMAVLIDFRAKPTDVLAMSKKVGAKAVITSKKLYRNFVSETNLFREEGLDVLDVSLFADFKDKGQPSPFDAKTLDLDRPALAILTSGTTGTPKAAVHNLRSLMRNIADLADVVNLQKNLTALTPLPISHIYGLSVFLVAQVLGLKTVLTDLDPVGFVKAIHRHKPHLIAALPQFYGALLSAPKGFIDLTDATLLLCGGAPLTVSLAEKFEARFDKRLNNGYGSTESKIVALNKDGPALSVGKPIGGVKIDIVNEQGEVLTDGSCGEVRISGPILMDGYLDNENATNKVLHDGHYYSGDFGRLEDGNLFVIGRKGDIVIVGGVVVRAGDVEEALRNYREVKDVAVTALQNKRLGQIIKASVVLMDDEVAKKLKSNDRNECREAQRQLECQFRAFCKKHLSRYKRPMKWEFLDPHDSLPKTLAGKTDKKMIAPGHYS